MVDFLIDITATLLEFLMLFIMLRKRSVFSARSFMLSGALYLASVRSLTIYGLSPASKLLILLALDTAIGHAFFRHRISKAFTLGLLHFTSIYLGEIAVQSCLMFFYGTNLAGLQRHPALWISSVFLSKLLGILCCFAFRRIFGELQYSYSPLLSICILFPLCSILGSMALLEGYILGYTNLPGITLLPLLYLCLLAASVCLLYIYQYYFRIKEIQLGRRLNEKQMLAVFHLYKNRIDQEINNRKIYHDIHAHISTLKRMEASPVREEYTREILDRLKDMSFYPETGNDILDIILIEKKPACDEAGVKLICIGNFKNLLFIKPFDLVTIFHNAIDNALNEYKSYEYPEKVIEIQTWVFRNFINIRISNDCIPHTSVKEMQNPDLHGYGLKNIQQAVSGYGGETGATLEDGKFYLRITIPHRFSRKAETN